MEDYVESGWGFLNNDSGSSSASDNTSESSNDSSGSYAYDDDVSGVDFSIPSSGSYAYDDNVSGVDFWNPSSGNKTVVKNNSSNDNSSNSDEKNNQQKVIDFISVNEETDTKFKSYTTINYANNKIQNVSQKVNKILNANPAWSKMDALNYLDGKWTKMGYADNSPRWNNGRLKGLEVNEEIKGIKGGKDYNTWGGGLRSSWEGNWGTLTDKDTYVENLTIREHSQHLEPGSAAWNRNKALSKASSNLRVGSSSLGDILGGFIISSLGLPINLLSGATTSQRDEINKREQELLQSNVITQDIKDLLAQYKTVSGNVDDSLDAGSPNPTEFAQKMTLEQQLQNAVGMEMPAILKTMSMDGDNAIFNQQINDSEFKHFKTRLKSIEDDKNDTEQVSRYGGRIVEEETEDAETDTDTQTTIDLADPYIGLAWWKDRGGFEKLFGLPLPYAKQDTIETATLKEGGIIGYQVGGSVRQPQMIQDPNAAPASMRADDVNLQAETGDFIMGYPAMQKSGTRVRSLVEQAMLKAKDAGVKTKGYKSGDKVDILVHNGEMQIPNEIIKYIDGGYTTLKKLNAPSKHAEGETVQEGFMQKPQDDKVLDEMQTNLNETKEVKSNLGENIELGEDNLLNKKIYPTEELVGKEKKQNKNVFYREGWNFFEDKNWDTIKKKFKSLLPSSYKNLHKTAYTNAAMNDLKNALSGASPESNRELLSKLKNPKFLKQVHKASQMNMVMSNAHAIAGKDLEYTTELSDNGLVYRYTPSNIYNRKLSAPYGKKKYIQDDTLLNFLKRNENDGYKEQGIHIVDGKEHIGYGHRIQSAEEKKIFEKIINENGGIFPEAMASQLLVDDIRNHKGDARKVYNNFVKSKSQDKYNNINLKTRNFDSVSPNVRDMLTALAFNIGGKENKLFGEDQSGLAEFDDFMIAAANGDYPTMSKEYTVKGLDRRNDDFYKSFLSDAVDNNL